MDIPIAFYRKQNSSSYPPAREQLADFLQDEDFSPGALTFSHLEEADLQLVGPFVLLGKRLLRVWRHYIDKASAGEYNKTSREFNINHNHDADR